MKWIITMVGAATVMFILRDMFHTLWHPTRHGGLSRMVMTSLWRLSSRLSPRRRAAGLAGPLGMVVVVAMWACGVAVGWALVYWPHMPHGFSFATGLDPMEHSTPVDALYISLVTLATLGLGDITPAVGWLRIVAPLEALVGFALLTAIVSWILGIYPALTRRRALALRLSHLRRAHLTEESLDTAPAVALLDGLAADIARVHVDFLQYAESYYFHDGLGDTSLAQTLGYAAELGQSIRTTGHADVRTSTAVLTVALEDLAAVLDQRFLHTGGSVYEIFQAYARDHNGLGPA